jgi:hypothetical protein
MNETSATARTASLIVLLSLCMPLLFSVAVFAAAIGDQVELKATHQAGVPFHQAPGGTQSFSESLQEPWPP